MLVGIVALGLLYTQGCCPVKLTLCCVCYLIWNDNARDQPSLHWTVTYKGLGHSSLAKELVSSGRPPNFKSWSPTTPLNFNTFHSTSSIQLTIARVTTTAVSQIIMHLTPYYLLAFFLVPSFAAPPLKKRSTSFSHGDIVGVRPGELEGTTRAVCSLPSPKTKMLICSVGVQGYIHSSWCCPWYPSSGHRKISSCDDFQEAAQ
jgi:hypothetical protein